MLAPAGGNEVHDRALRVYLRFLAAAASLRSRLNGPSAGARKAAIVIAPVGGGALRSCRFRRWYRGGGGLMGVMRSSCRAGCGRCLMRVRGVAYPSAWVSRGVCPACLARRSPQQSNSMTRLPWPGAGERNGRPSAPGPGLKVGDARWWPIIDHARPAVADNRLFLRSCAPYRAIRQPVHLSCVVSLALSGGNRGIAVARGANLLRHSAPRPQFCARCDAANRRRAAQPSLDPTRITPRSNLSMLHTRHPGRETHHSDRRISRRGMSRSMSALGFKFRTSGFCCALRGGPSLSGGATGVRHHARVLSWAVEPHHRNSAAIAC